MPDIHPGGRRHVVSPDSMAAWRFDVADVAKWDAVKVYSLRKGPDFRVTPFLAQGDGPKVYVIDDSLDAFRRRRRSRNAAP